MLRLLEAGAQPDMQDDMGCTALQRAAMAGNSPVIEHLLNRKADVDDESLHVAARNLELPAMQMLLNHGASTSLPGIVRCDGRLPLAELCRKANLRENPPHLKKTIKCLSEATKDLEVLTDGKSFILQALDNDSALKMTSALLNSCVSLKDGLNHDFNIYSKGSRRYSPTAYVRHFKCIESPAYRSPILSRQCCTLDACPAPSLEKLLHSHKCEDRFWDDKAGANQPRGFCKPPDKITIALREAEMRRQEQERIAREYAEEKARKDRAAAEERARKEQIQRDLDAAAAAERRREQERLRAIEDETRATERKAAADRRAIELRTEAELREKRLIAEEEARQDKMKHLQEQAEFNAQLDRQRQMDKQVERTLRERSNIQIDQKKREANFQRDVLKEQNRLIGERRRYIDSAQGMFREASYAGVNPRGVGRVLGEIEYDP